MGSFASFKENRALGPRENGLSSHTGSPAVKKEGEEKKRRKNLSARPEILIKVHTTTSLFSRRKNWGLRLYKCIFPVHMVIHHKAREVAGHLHQVRHTKVDLFFVSFKIKRNTRDSPQWSIKCYKTGPARPPWRGCSVKTIPKKKKKVTRNRTHLDRKDSVGNKRIFIEVF